MPMITIVILVNSRQVKTRQNTHRSVAYNDNDNDNNNHNDNHYSMNSHGMKIISYLMFIHLFSSADLSSILFHLISLFSILLYFKLIRFDSILFYFILLNLIYYIVQYSISYQWMICVYLSVCPSVCLCVYLYE